MTLVSLADAQITFADLQRWAFLVSAVGFFIYPCLLLFLTSLEGWATGRSAEKRLHEKRDADDGKVKAKNADLRHPVPSLLYPVVQLFFNVAGSLWSIIVFTTFALRLMVYSLLLAPWFLKVGYIYFRSPRRVLRGIRYGEYSRNYVDIYLPEPSSADGADSPKEPVPVVVAVMGGAWIIGHRMWNAQLGWRLSEAGALVVAVDYRNFPTVYMDSMVEDVNRGLEWVFANIAAYGGDPNNVTLVGQSAGSHLSTMALLKHSVAEAGGLEGAWSVSDLRGFVSVSGAYDLVALQSHLSSRGLPRILSGICPNSDLGPYSPSQILDTKAWQGPLAAAAAAKLPPVYLFHGKDDKSIPCNTMLHFAKQLRTKGVRSVTADLRAGVGHAEPVIEDPFRGGDMQVQIILPFLVGDERAQSILKALPVPTPRAPGPLVRAAMYIMPF